MKTIKHLTLFILVGSIMACKTPNKHVNINLPDTIKADLSYALDKFAIELQKSGYNYSINDASSPSHIQINLELKNTETATDGFYWKNEKSTIDLTSSTTRGLLYGILALTEAVNEGRELVDIKDKSIVAHYPFRAIKFNLPWFSYRSGDNLSLHMETCKDLKFWEDFLDMMVENRFNALTLWNLHPFIYMVKPSSFPEASPFTNQEMNEWKTFWKALFKMAKTRGIETYVVNWNIFVSQEFAKAHGAAGYSKDSGFWGNGETSEVLEKYTKEIVTQTINEYEDLTGIGITLGERMGGMTSEQRRDWIDRTLIAGLKAADRKAKLIYRAPLSAGTSSHGTVSVTTEQITREAIENMGLDDEVLVEFKFNWSHAHSSPKVSIVHGGILTDTYWNPISDKYKGVWTMRNEDFFVLRWVQPDFIRDFINFNSQAYINGCIIGSETYIPAKDYITKNEHRTWDYAFQRQWMFYKIWGNLLYNSKTPDAFFADAFNKKFGISFGDKLLKAWKFSSMNANRFASFHRGTWDATIYSEGFTAEQGKFIDINKFIDHPVLDSSYVNIIDFLANNYDDNTQITPLQLAEICASESKNALGIVEEIRDESTSKELDIELTDIEAWSAYGQYLAHKIKGAVALEQFNQTKEEKFKVTAIENLEEGLKHWKVLTEKVEKYNVAELPYQFDPNFSWRKHIKDVENDITIARNAQ